MRYFQEKKRDDPPSYVWEGKNTARFVVLEVKYPKKPEDMDKGYGIVIAELQQDDNAEALMLQGRSYTVCIKGKLVRPEVGKSYQGTLECIFDDTSPNPRFHEWCLRSHASWEAGPATGAEIEQFLQQIPNIGPIRAKKLVRTFGKTVLELAPKKFLQTVLGGSLLDEAVASCRNMLVNYKNYKFLGQMGLPETQRARLQERYADLDIEEEIREDPIGLAKAEIVPFETAMIIWARLGIEADDPRIVGACAEYVIKQFGQRGHCYMEFRKVMSGIGSVKGVETYLPGLNIAKRWKDENWGSLPEVHKSIQTDKYGHLWSRDLWAAEAQFVDKIVTKLKTPPLLNDGQLAHASRLLDSYVQQGKVRMSPSQKEAVMLALSSPVTLITGSAGTGKTTIQKALVTVLRDLRIGPVQIMAPTGKAAANATEKTGMVATTAHKALQFLPGSLNAGRNEDNPLEGQVIIVDEVGMLDIRIASLLMNAVAEKAYVVFVGDPQQLPAVGPGKVLDDLIQSEVIPQAHLTQTFRQDTNSKLLELCYSLIKDDPEPMSLIKGDGSMRYSDITVIPTQKPTEIVDWLKRFYDEHDPETVRVLCGYKGLKEIVATDVTGKETRAYRDAGVNHLNVEISRYLFANIPGPKITLGDFTYAEGMRCLWLQNITVKDKVNEFADPLLDMVNGQEFTIQTIEIGENEKEHIIFSTRNTKGQQVVYDIQASKYADNMFVPAYALTVHKAQGSEYPTVVFVIREGDRRRLTRALVYTAVTRAAKHVIVIGDYEALWGRPARDNERNTGVAQKLRHFVNQEKKRQMQLAEMQIAA